MSGSGYNPIYKNVDPEELYRKLGLDYQTGLPLDKRGLATGKTVDGQLVVTPAPDPRTPRQIANDADDAETSETRNSDTPR